MKTQTKIAFAAATMICLMTFVPAAALSQEPDVRTIIQKSVEANQRDFKAAPHYSYDERDKVDQGTRTYHVSMINGSPYSRLVAINGKPLSADENAREEQKFRQEIARRNAETPGQQRQRIAKYERDRKRDQDLLNQMTEAFDFHLLGTRKLNGFDVYYLKATPRPDYRPPNMDTQVLTGMEGRLWIDKDSFQWVKVTAQVTKPVSIEGFLAQVEPGTNFLLEKTPVGNGIWQPRHFSMHSHAKVLFLFNRSSSEEEWYSNYSREHDNGQGAARVPRS